MSDLYSALAEAWVAIPLEQGRFFNPGQPATRLRLRVAIPLEQGRFFNEIAGAIIVALNSRNPFGAGTVFQ